MTRRFCGAARRERTGDGDAGDPGHLAEAAAGGGLARAGRV